MHGTSERMHHHQAVEVSSTHVLAAQSGDEAAFVLLYRHIHPGLLRYLRVLVGADAEDVAAEAWSQVCRDLLRFTGELDAFRGWVTTIGRNRALDHLRSSRRHPAIPVPPSDLWFHLASVNVAEEATAALATRDALALIATLPREQAEAVMLRVVLDLDAKTAGAVVGRSAGAVRTAAHRGLRALAQKVAAEHAEDRDEGQGNR